MYRSSILTAIAATSLLIAPSASAATLVSTELVLSVDVSSSIDSQEFQLQQQGYADAFRDIEIINQITSLRDGLAVNMQFWASRVGNSTGWFHITDATSANAFADAIDSLSRFSAGNLTNIAAGINSATDLILNNDFEGTNKVIDVSGDGIQNTGCSPNPTCRLPMLAAARDNAVSNGIVVNGLAIGSLGQAAYFENYVVGGEDAFVIGVQDFDDFGNGIKTKLVAEITPPDAPQSVPEPLSLLALASFTGFLLSAGCRRS